MAFGVEEFPFTSEYDSDLRAVLKYIREVKKLIASYDDIIAELKQELVNIQDLYPRVDALERATADLGEIRANIDNLFDGLQKLGNKEKADINNLQRQIDDVKDSIIKFEADVKDVYNYVNYNVAVLNSTIKKNYDYLLGVISDLDVRVNREVEYIIWRLDQIDTSVLNPWHTVEGRITQDRNVKHIYADLADGCLTAEEYCRLGLSANGYSDFDISAMQYARYSKEKLHYYWVFSPAYGFLQEINNVLTSILNFVYDTYTADAYTELDLTADEYADLSYSADDYLKANYSGGGGGGDTRGFIKYDISNSGLTRREYEHLGINQS